MRTFHTGGVASAEDITQGLPRVEELFEGRKPKHLAIISEIDGVVRLGEEKKKRMAYVTRNVDGDVDEKSYVIPYGCLLYTSAIWCWSSLITGSTKPRNTRSSSARSGT